MRNISVFGTYVLNLLDDTMFAMIGLIMLLKYECMYKIHKSLFY